MGEDSAQSLEEAIGRYNEAWNDHDLDAIMSMHAPDMVFENHTAGESAEGDEVREHIGAIFESWPDLHFETRRLYVRDGRGHPGVDGQRHSLEHDAPRRPGRGADRRDGSSGGAST